MEAACRRSGRLVAIGGVTLERAPLCLAAGADSAAVGPDITLNADPEARASACWPRRGGRLDAAKRRSR